MQVEISSVIHGFFRSFVLLQKFLEAEYLGFFKKRFNRLDRNGNIDGANLGEPAVDFELDYIANGEGSFRLSDQLGKVVVIAFFAPN